jgi:hypothetical protein
VFLSSRQKASCGNWYVRAGGYTTRVLARGMGRGCRHKSNPATHRTCAGARVQSHSDSSPFATSRLVGWHS